MPRIAALPDHLVNQIAAGEVVERPANALKEIVENSIDAGATAVDVELEGGGIRLIRVGDNGGGIHPDDIELALHRHATSKIKTLNDLEHVASMGFRGEGLASIASVSRLTLTSRQEDSSHATQVKAEDGKLSSPTAAAHPVGTTIEAAELFFNTPARRKFLKSENTEYAHCATMLERLALAHPHIAFSLKRDGKQVFKLPAQSLHERIAAIVGDDFQTASLEIDSGNSALRLYGAIAKPTFAKGKTDKQYCFVNHRFVRDKVMLHAVKQAYRDVLHNALTPAFVLFLELPPECADSKPKMLEYAARSRRSDGIPTHRQKHHDRNQEKNMTYQVLARKWRPKTFSDLVGQEHVVKALQNALDEGRLHHAYLLTGTRGVGKTTIARILAKSLNCENAQHGEPCGVCQSCTQIDAGRYVDLLEIDAASNTGIDNIREVLENAQYAPTAGKYKVYIIDEVHMLSKSAFNAMLKTLEEPPEHVKFILATTDPHKVPVTVLSRCLQFVLRNMTAQQVADHLAHVLDSEKIAYDPPALQLLGRAAAGSMRDALSLLDQAIALGSGKVAENDVRQMIGAVDKQYLYELLTGIVNQDGEALLAKAQEMAACAVGFDNALGELAILLQQLALIQAVPSALAHDDPDSDILHRLAQTISGEQIQLYYQIAVHGKRDLGLAPDEYAGFMMTLLRMLAFAPLAAASCDANAVIENTELQSPSAQTAEKETAAKKPQPRPEADAAQTPVQTASAAAMPSEGKTAGPVSHQENNDVPPWEDAPDKTETAAGTARTSAKSIQTASEAETPPENQVSKNKAADNETEASLSEVPSENPIQATPNDEAVETETFAHEAPAEPFYGFPDNDCPPEDGVEIPPPDWANVLPADTAGGGTDEEAEAGGIGGNNTPSAPPPEFSTENWAAIVRHFARKLGAAQMPAQHSAWTEYRSDTGLMVLAMTAEARATADKKRLDKIRDTLAQAYGLQLTLQTEDWRDEAGRETPAMQDKRVQAEDRQKAQALLEADPAAQKILQAFGAQWQPESLELAANRP